jgi:hypothetical protein
MSYTITTKDGITIDNIPDDIDPNSQELKDRVAKIRADNQMVAPVQIAPEPDLTLNRVGELLSRGAAPAVAGATIGSVAGPAGSLVGSMAVPIGDALNTIVNELSKGNTAVENYIRGLMGREQTATPMQLPMVSGMVSRGMEKIGLGAEPTSTTERVIEVGGAGFSGAGTQLPALTKLAKEGASAVTRNVAAQLAQAPKTQVAVSAPASMVAQTVTEATGSPIAGMVAGATTGAASGLRPRKIEAIPTAEQLKMQATQAYDRANKAGVVISPQSLKNTYPIFTNAVKEAGFDPDLHPQVNIVLNRLAKENQNPKTLQELDTLRRIVRAPTKTFDNPDQQRVAYRLLDEFDNYIANLSDKDLAIPKKSLDLGKFGVIEIEDAMSPKVASKDAISSLKEARSLYSKSIKSDTIADLMERAEITAGANYTQSGIENALRQELKSLAKNKKRLAGFNQTEKDAIIAAAKGGNLQNFLRLVGKLAPTSVISGGGAAGIGYLAGGTTGAIALPLIGGAGRYAATQMGLQNMRDIQDLVALGRTPNVIQSRTGLVPQTSIRGLLSPQIIEEELNQLN